MGAPANATLARNDIRLLIRALPLRANLYHNDGRTLPRLGGFILHGGVELCDGRSDDAQSETLLARADPPRGEPWAQAPKEQTEA